MSGDAIGTVYAVFGSEDEATRIGRAMVERRLAACVNILGPCQSIYRWQGAIEEAGEVAALFKTARDRTEALIAAIGELHSYETPAIAAWPIEAADPAYRGWVIAETR
jgi:periplasmic divalent cation tolerance protein